MTGEAAAQQRRTEPSNQLRFLATVMKVRTVAGK
nr:MAG TPA: hypothetical protein [Caudoviricetes sp.]